MTDSDPWADSPAPVILCHDDPLVTSRTVTKPLALDTPATKGDRAIVEDKITELRREVDRRSDSSEKRHDAGAVAVAETRDKLGTTSTVAWVALAVSGVSVALRILKLLME